jgi:transposase
MVESGERQTEVARKLGISPSMLGAWVAAARGKAVVHKEESSESERNKALERELKQARMELDILKKALGYFAKESK